MVEYINKGIFYREEDGAADVGLVVGEGALVVDD
jgi:hypothetical protein